MTKKNAAHRLTTLLGFISVLAACYAHAKSMQSGQVSATVLAVQMPASSLGETTTLLPDGRQLITGGQESDGQVKASAIVQDMTTGGIKQLSATLNYARAFHSATVLPDGKVLILGGIGANGSVVSQAELFDPESETFEVLSSGAPKPRAFHTATLLTDGHLFIAGGVSPSGHALSTTELWDFRQHVSISSSTRLIEPRITHRASLLADGRVLLSGGKNEKFVSVSDAEIYDPQSQTIAVADAAEIVTMNGGIAEVKATSPEDKAINIPVDTFISMRFSRGLLVESINQQSVVLNGPEGVVQAKVVGAENGMLAFLTPRVALLPGTTYSVTFSGGVDINDAPVAFTQFTFTTAGAGPEEDSWIPSPGWRNDHGDSEWRNLPPLQADAGVTALAGQVLKLDGTPLNHVTLQIDNRKAFSDRTGRFLMTEIVPGHHSLMIIASSANTKDRTYGIYEAGVDVKAGQTNVLNYTIWMTPLDTAHTVTIPSPTTAETVVTSPLLPGLELHIPANTVIIGYDGKVVTRINITPIPINQPPFPLPVGVQVPIYFTIQPGSAYIKVTAVYGPKGAWLLYPNTYHFVSGTQFNFWNYNADDKGWFVYGQGRVSADGSQVIPNPNVVLYEFSGAMVGNPGSAPPGGPAGGGGGHPPFPPGSPPGPPPGPPPGGGGCEGDTDPRGCPPDLREPKPKGGDPVDLGTGLFVYTKSDLYVPDVIPIVIARTYRPGDSVSRAFGIGTNQRYDMFMVGSNNLTGGYIWQDLVLPDGGRIHFQRVSPCTGANGYCDYLNAIYEASTAPGGFFGATLKWIGSQAGPGHSSWALTRKDGTVYYFLDSDGSSYSRSSAVVAMNDRYGNSLTFTRDGGFNLTQITTQNGRWVKLTYDTSSRITLAQDNIGRTVQYAYDAGGRLSQVTDANGGITQYSYDAFNQMLTIQDARGIFYLTNQYDSSGRVIKQTFADNTMVQFTYTTNSATGSITQTDETDQRGNTSRTTFNANGYITSQIYALGKPEQQTITYVRDPNTNLVSSIIDGLGRETDYTSDAQSNILSVTTLAKTPAATTTQFTYDPTFSQLTSVTDPLNHVTTLQRDPSNGNLLVIIDPLQNQTSFTYYPDGQKKTITDALQNTTQFSYDSGDLVSITDPMLNVSSMLTDGVGRLLSQTDALGSTTKFAYDALSDLIKTTDPKGGITTFSYDPNGNLIAIQDPNQQGTGVQTVYTYDNMDRVLTRTDPLMRQESYTYDQAGNMTLFIDRRGKATTFTYDALGRVSLAAFGDANKLESTISYTYDATSRLTQTSEINISSGGTENTYLTYDDQARVYSRKSPLGMVSYVLDVAGRRSTMTVEGEAPVSYSYDDANRLTQITQGTAHTLFGFDVANRRTSLTLPNGIEATYCYDGDSHLVSIFYNPGTITSCSNGSGTVGSLTYGYDTIGRRIKMGGSLARIGLPQPVVSATYDVANEVVQWNGTSLTYDAGGNLINDGVNSYVWNARGELVAMGMSTFQYDAAGHRTRNQTGKGFLYDGPNVIQELTGNAPTANITGSGIDEFFVRSDSAGTYSPITDALGSVLALSDSGGNMVTQYTYDPFGNTSVSGTANSNTIQYAGRENDGTGLYYYRARYYSPSLGRFISEDPIGFFGGMNLYRYASGNPISYRDPFGLYEGADDAVAIAGGAVYGLASQAISDALTGQLSSWQTYAGACVGGAVGGETLLLTGNPQLAGLAGGVAGNLTKQGLTMLTGNQSAFNYDGLAMDSFLGYATGLPDAEAAPYLRGFTKALATGYPTSIALGVGDAGNRYCEKKESGRKDKSE